jgi:ParB-like chromosome segregation protein Spo0J
MVLLDIKKLKPHPDNPRRISFRDMEKLCDDITRIPEFFEARPIICDKNYLIWAGNSRFKAAQKLGMKQVPVQVIDLPEDQMREIMVKDNLHWGNWDANMLLDWDIKELTDFGLEFTKSFDENNLTEESEEPGAGKKKPKAKKIITCPHCNQDFEL